MSTGGDLFTFRRWWLKFLYVLNCRRFITCT